MQERRLFEFKTGRRDRRSIRFVRRRTALTFALVATIGISALAFASGIALGLRLVAQEATYDHFAHHADNEHSCDETEEESHSDHPAHEASGGPELPPRRLIDTALSPGDYMAKAHTVAWEATPGRLPVGGARIGSTFGNRVDPFKRRVRFHSGIDFVANKGTPILATASGRVSFAGKKHDYGNLVEIDHGNGLVTRYGHASRLVVRTGDRVSPRQHIADVGSTGRSTGPHLHFELLANDKPIDPAAYLEAFAKDSSSRGLSA
jgi:murein DD-endopeptidase MepM/ murein hydrolase activator NlpD